MTTRHLFTPYLSARVLVFCCAISGCAQTGNRAPLDVGHVTIGGAVIHPQSYEEVELQKESSIVQEASVVSHKGSEEHIFRGVLLSQLLGRTEISADPEKLGGILDRYIVARAADGYQVVFSTGEISPEFGHEEVLLATRDVPIPTNTAQPTPVFVTAPTDRMGGRYVANVTAIDVRVPDTRAPALPASPGLFTIDGAVQQSAAVSDAMIGQLPQAELMLGDVDYVGVSLWALLNQTTMLRPDASLKNPLLSMAIVATGLDGYRSTLSLAEISPEFGNRDVIVGWPKGAGPHEPGSARLIVGDDNKRGRSVAHLVELTVESAGPGK